MRFRPEQHLRRQADFRAVREEGRRVECGAFTRIPEPEIEEIDASRKRRLRPKKEPTRPAEEEG